MLIHLHGVKGSLHLYTLFSRYLNACCTLIKYSLHKLRHGTTVYVAKVDIFERIILLIQSQEGTYQLSFLSRPERLG